MKSNGGLSSILSDYDNLKDDIEYYGKRCERLEKQVQYLENLNITEQQRMQSYLTGLKDMLSNVLDTFHKIAMSIPVSEDKKKRIIEILNEGEKLKWIM